MGQLTIGGVLYEIYGDRPGADAYFKAAVYGSTWSDAEGSVRNQALVTAMRVFEVTRWQGSPTQPISPVPQPPTPQPAGTQPLSWPRSGLSDQEGVPVPDSSIPIDVINGSYEYALAVLADPESVVAQQSGSNVKVQKQSQRVEGAITVSSEVQYFNPTTGRVPTFNQAVLGYISLWLEAGISGGLTTVSGTERPSNFDDGRLDYGYTRGLG